jgi:hypothetical protein
VRLAPESVGERRSQRAVDETTGERRLLGGAALAPEERAGDSTHGVHALFDIDGEREEIHTLTQPTARCCGHEYLGVADADLDGPIGELGELARGQRDDLVA